MKLTCELCFSTHHKGVFPAQLAKTNGLPILPSHCAEPLFVFGPAVGALWSVSVRVFVANNSTNEPKNQLLKISTNFTKHSGTAIHTCGAYGSIGKEQQQREQKPERPFRLLARWCAFCLATAGRSGKSESFVKFMEIFLFDCWQKGWQQRFAHMLDGLNEKKIEKNTGRGVSFHCVKWARARCTHSTARKRTVATHRLAASVMQSGHIQSLFLAAHVRHFWSFYELCIFYDLIYPVFVRWTQNPRTGWLIFRTSWKRCFSNIFFGRASWISQTGTIFC